MSMRLKGVIGGIVGTIGMGTALGTLLAFLAAQTASNAGEPGYQTAPLFPRELANVPVNGNDLIEDPAAIQAKFGFSNLVSCLMPSNCETLMFLDKLDAIETPRVNWAKPYERGPIRVLWIGMPSYSDLGDREWFELKQRADLAVDCLTLPCSVDGWHPSVTADTRFMDYVRGRIEAALAKDYDVIVWNGQIWRAQKIDTKLMDRLLEKVKGGTGLVINFGSPSKNGRFPMLKEYVDMLMAAGGRAGALAQRKGKPKRAEVDHPVTDGVSFALWPSLKAPTSGASPGTAALATVDGGAFILAAQSGRGRVVSVDYQCEGFCSLIPATQDKREGDYFEPVYALWLKAILWAAGKEPSVRMKTPDAVDCAAGKSAKVTVTLSNTAEGRADIKLDYRLQDPFGEFEKSGEVVVTVGKEPSASVLELPVSQVNGTHRLDLWVKSGGKTANFGSVALIVSGGAEMEVETLDTIVKLDGVVRYKVKTPGRSGTLRVVASDGSDRVFLASKSKIENELTVEVDLARSLLPRNRIDFLLVENGAVTARRSETLYVPRVGLASLKGEFPILSYGLIGLAEHQRKYVGDIYRHLGFNGVYVNNHSSDYLKTAADQGLFLVDGVIAPIGYNTGRLDKDGKPVIKDFFTFKQQNFEKELDINPLKPAVWEAVLARIAKDKEDIRRYGALGRPINEEDCAVYTNVKDGRLQGAQACQCEASLAAFRSKMKAKYKEIAALNQMWGTDYKEFEQARCVEEDEVADSANPSAWVEFREFMNEWYAKDYYDATRKAHEDLDPTFGVGPGCPFWLQGSTGLNPTYRGGDYSKMRPTLRFMMAYGGRESEVFDDTFCGQPGGQKYDPPLYWRQWGSWYFLLNGADALWYYYVGSFIGHELAYRRHAEWIREGIHGIIDGVGPLVSGAKPVKNQVRIFYSSENYAMMWLNRRQKDARQPLGDDHTADTLGAVMRNIAFLQPKFVFAEEIAAGGLADCSLLVLSQATNMDEATAEAVRKFVQNGGFVVADFMPATRHRPGKKREGGSLLRDVFGVDEGGASLRRDLRVWYSVGIGPMENVITHENLWLKTDVSCEGLKATTARPMGSVMSEDGKADVPAFFLNEFGKGKAMLLNFQYRDLDIDGLGFHQVFARMLLKLSGAHPPARIVDPKTDADLPYRPLFVFKRGAATLLGSIRGVSKVVGDRPTLVDEGGMFERADDVKFTWDANAHAYNVRSRKYLGFGKSADVDLPPFEGRLLALLPYKVAAVALSGPDKLKAGQTAAIAAEIKAEGGQPGEHVFRLEVSSPTGCKIPLYCRTVAGAAGKAKIEIPFAFNDRPGKWEVTVRDVMTGVEANKSINLE